MEPLINHASWLYEWMSNHLSTPSLIISSLILAFSICFFIFKNLTISSKSLPLPPGPPSLPILGYLPFLSHDLHKHFTKMSLTYGPIFKFYLGSKLLIVVQSTELVKPVVRDQDNAFANRDPPIVASIISYGCQGLVWSDNNSYWRNLRKLFVQELLSNKNIEACRSFRRDAVRKTIKNVFGKIGSVIDVSEVAFSTEEMVITSMVWGNTSDSHLGGELQRLVNKLVELVGKPNVSDIFPSLAWFDLQGIERETKKYVMQLDRIFESIIDDRIKSNSKKSQDAVGHEGKKDFLQILLELKDQNVATSLNVTQIKALLMDVMVGGTETTTTVIQWAMAEIMHNQSIMKRIQEELSEIVGVNNIVEESHLPKLQYLDATIKETLRLHPVIPLILPRSPSQDCVVGGYSIPKGSTVFLNVWAMHRDPKYWDNPLEFNPERFLNSKKGDFKGNNLNFLPFGSGRRLCPGIPLAEKMQMYILASLLHSFDWSLPEGEEHDFSEKFGVTLAKTKPVIAVPSQRLPNESLYM